MSGTPFMPLWVSDFLGDTLDLDATEIGAYMLLLMAQWNRDGDSLPSDTKKLQRVARCGRNWASVWSSIEQFFKEDENGIYSKRLRFEAHNVAAKREVNARNGALGGKAKSLKTNNAPVATATESLERSPSIPEPEPEREEREAIASPKKQKRKSSLPDGWVPSDRNIQDAMEQQFTEREIQDEADKFADYHRAKGTIFADWDAGWRTWIRNTRRYGTSSRMAVPTSISGRGQGGSIASIVARRRAGGEV